MTLWNCKHDVPPEELEQHVKDFHMNDAITSANEEIQRTDELIDSTKELTEEIMDQYDIDFEDNVCPYCLKEFDGKTSHGSCCK